MNWKLIPSLPKNTDFIRTLVRGWGMVATVDLFTKGLGFLVFPIYAKIMSPAEYGAYNYACIISGVASGVFGLGQYSIFSRAESESLETRSAIHSSLFANIFLGMIAWLLIFGVVQLFFRHLLFSKPISFQFLLVMAIFPIIQTLSQLVSIDFFLMRRYKMAAIRSITEFVLVNTLGICAVILFPKRSGDARLISFTIAYAFMILVFLPKSRLNEMLRSAIKYRTWNTPRWDDLRQGLPLSLNAMIGLASGNGDRYMLEKLAANTQLGVYAFAASIMSVLNMGFSSFNNVWLGVFYQDSRSNLWRIRMSIGVGLVWILISLLAIGSAAIMFSVVGGKFSAYAGARSLLPFIGFAYCFQIQSQLLQNFFNLFRIARYTTPVNLMMGVVSLSLGFLLIPKLGMMGAAIQTLVVSASGFVIFLAILIWIIRGNGGRNAQT